MRIRTVLPRSDTNKIEEATASSFLPQPVVGCRKVFANVGSNRHSPCENHECLRIRTVCPCSDTNKKEEAKASSFLLVPVVGVEPTRYRYHWILSPARLPIPSHRLIYDFVIISHKKQKINSRMKNIIKN